MGSGCSWARFFWGWWKCPKLDSGDGYTTLNKLNLLNFILSKVNFMMWIVCQLKKKAKWIQWFFHKNCRKILLAFRLLVRKSMLFKFLILLWISFPLKDSKIIGATLSQTKWKRGLLKSREAVLLDDEVWLFRLIPNLHIFLTKESPDLRKQSDLGNLEGGN